MSDGGTTTNRPRNCDWESLAIGTNETVDWLTVETFYRSSFLADNRTIVIICRIIQLILPLEISSSASIFSDNIVYLFVKLCLLESLVHSHGHAIVRFVWCPSRGVPQRRTTFADKESTFGLMRLFRSSAQLTRGNNKNRNGTAMVNLLFRNVQ